MHEIVSKAERGMIMKKISGVFLFVVLLLALTACGKSAVNQWQEQYDLGEKYLLEEDYEAAIVAFTAAIEIEPNDVRTYTGLVQAYMGLEDYDSAIAAVEEGLAVLSSSDQAQAEGARQAFLSVSADAYITRAENYQDMEEPQKALDDYKAALELIEQGAESSFSQEELEERIEQLENGENGEYSETDEQAVEQTTDGLLYLVSTGSYVWGSTSYLNLEYSYDEEGKVLKETHYNTTGVLTSILEYEYSDDGYTVLETSYNTNSGEVSGITVHIYNSDDDLLSSMKSYAGSTESYVTEYEYEYDSAGNLLSKTTYSYDADGALMNTSTSSWVYDEAGNVISDGSGGTYTYDENGNKLTWRYGGDSGTLIEYTYDEQGNLLTETSTDYYEGEASSPALDEYVYDDAGNQIKYIRYNGEGSIYSEVHSTYDEHGNLLSETYYTGMPSEDTLWFIYEYTYIAIDLAD